MGKTRVALLTAVNSEYIRGIWLGITRYARPERSWDLRHFDPGRPNAVRHMRAWKPDAVIACPPNQTVARQLNGWRIPVINVSNAEKIEGMIHVGLDDRAIGRMAADYLCNLAVEHFACCVRPGQMQTQRRFEGFSEALTKRGVEQIACISVAPGRTTAISRRLAKLPAPLAVFATGDQLALDVVAACHEADLAIPERILVLGVNNDPLMCELAYPRLSSISLPTRKIGYAAAAKVDEMLARPRTRVKDVLFAPSHVAPRQSTSNTAVHDPIVAEALRFLHENVAHAIGVDQMASHVGLGRRQFERRFRCTLKRSPYEELIRVRMESAKLLLAETRLTIRLIATRCGFSDGRQLATVFRRHVGTTPSAFRAEVE